MAYTTEQLTLATSATEVASTIAGNEQVVFYAGTMFVKCTYMDAAKIKALLLLVLGCPVQMSKVGPEYAFDFTV